MQTPAAETRPAWQPITPRGVAAFAHGALHRLWLVQFLVACVVAALVVWVLQAAWFPVLHSAIESLPAEGEIRSGQLKWHGDATQPLAENRFLAVVVDLNHQGGARSPAHVQLEFGKIDLRVLTLFGTLEQDYPSARVVAFNRRQLVPWWGAWAPELLALTAGVVILGLLLLWALLSTVYFLPVWLIGFFADRPLTLAGSWRLAGAALMPGALLMSGTIWAYGRGVLNLVELGVLFAAHLVLGWAYLVVSPLSMPRSAEAASKPNPFTPASPHPPPTAEPNIQQNPP